jgi:hypothetical protein
MEQRSQSPAAMKKKVEAMVAMVLELLPEVPHAQHAAV